MRRLIALTALIALVFTACKIETNFAATINADGSGTITAELGFDEEAADLLLQGDTNPFEGNDLSALPGAEFTEETRGDMTFYVITAPVDDVTEIENALLGTDNSLLESFDITVSDNRVSVTGSANAEQAFGEDLQGFDPAMLEDSLSATVRLTLPGRILSSNADSQSGNELTWAIPLFGGTLDIQAESDPTQEPGGDGGGFPVWLIALIVVVVLAAAAWFFMNRTKGSPAPAASVPETPEAPVADDVPPPPPSE